MDAAIEVEGLVKSYDGRRVVDQLDLEIAAGEVVALLGPNGAGKTTTVECIEGFRRPDSGQIRVLGLHPQLERAALTPRLGVMLQEGGVYQAASPREVLRLFARLHPRARSPEELIERLDLGAVANARYRTLSGGEKQRLNLALALIGMPEVLVLDEPTAGMDPEMTQATWELIRSHRREGVTVLLTTHVMREAEHLADRVAILARGRLLADDSPSALVAAYAPTSLVVTTPEAIDVAALSGAIGAEVAEQAVGRYVVQAPTEPPGVVMARITAWFARRDLPLTGVTAGGEGLEAAYLELTRRAFGVAGGPSGLLDGPDDLPVPAPAPDDEPGGADR